MDFKTYPMPFDERIQHIYMLQHWKLFLTIIALLIITSIIFLIITYKVNGYIIEWFSVSIIISAFALVAALIITAMMGLYYYDASSNNQNMRYISYEGNGEIVENCDTNSNDYRTISFNSGIEQYKLTINKKYNISKGDLIKISSNGKIPTIDYSENIKRNLTYNTITSEHNLDVKIKHDGKWYKIDVNTFDNW